ncbi:MAG TPA: class I SAM-dependent methyltransferase [Planktothrix sp.]|jgi:ubiquinone/menaquinone biosynthesis C-methylase UbiE
MPDKDREKHNELQAQYFEECADKFDLEIPGDIQERTATIVETAGMDASTRILDVGTGSGVLIGHFLASGARQENIVGCDLTPAMLAIASQHYSKVYFWNGDVMEFSFHSLPSDFPPHIRSFDRIFFNACFANMHDRRAVLAHCLGLTSEGGKIVISHPLPKIVDALHRSDPEIVPHLLPSKEEAETWAKELGLALEHFQSTDTLYLTIFRRIKCS